MADQELSTEELYDSYDPPKGSGNFFSLEDGKTARVRFMSEPYVYEAVFTDKEGKESISTRYAWLIWNHDERRAQVLKQSATFYSSLATLVRNPDFGDPKDYDVHITRTGTGTDSKYPVTGARKNIELTDEALQQIADMDIVKDSREPVIMSLRDFIKAGKKFVDKDGRPMIRELADDKAPVKDL